MIPHVVVAAFEKFPKKFTLWYEGGVTFGTVPMCHSKNKGVLGS